MDQELNKNGKHGARVYAQTDGVFLVKQTIKRGTDQNDPYVIDEHRECFVNPGNDEALGKAVREALEGNLQTSSN